MFQFDVIGEDQRCVQPDFRKHIEHCREILRLDLYLINPCMRMTLDLWIRDYRYRIMYATRCCASCRYHIPISARGIKFFQQIPTDRFKTYRRSQRKLGFSKFSHLNCTSDRCQ